MSYKKYIIFIALTCFLIVSGIFALFFWKEYVIQKETEEILKEVSLQDNVLEQDADRHLEDAAEDEIVSSPDIQNTDIGKEEYESRTQKVFFTSQAPFGEWSDEIFQNACEEASMLMAMAWVRDEVFSPEQVKQAILDITEFERKIFGRKVLDASTEDVARVMKEYYRYDTIQVKHDIVLEDIKVAIQAGAVIIVPADGRVLHNPNFTQPGPEYHMLVITGYDAKNREFITNDPGTRRGESYRYDEQVLYNAIRDYPTGNHEPITKNTKSMIVVKK